MSKTSVIIMAAALLSAPVMHAKTKAPVVVAMPGQRTVAATIIRKADFIACPISLLSDNKGPEEKLADLQTATQTIMSAAARSSNILVHPGSVSLSGDSHPVALTKSSSGRDAFSKSQLYILVAVKDGKPDIFAGGLAITKFLAGLKLPDKVRCLPGQIQLAVADPEQHRLAILQAIAESVRQVRSVLAQSGEIQITGLANPIAARQVDDENIELFIEYSLSLAGKGMF